MKDVVLVASVTSILVAVLATSPTFGQGSGVLAGRVSDASGNPMVGVLVKARIDRMTVTVPSQRDGSFRLTELRPGTYEVRAEQRGFAADARRVVVPSTTSLHFAMTTAPVDSHDLSGVDLEKVLPEGPYKKRLLGCEICHSWTGLTSRKQFRADTWVYGMRTMVGKKIASIDPKDMQPMAEYLQASFGPDAKLPLDLLSTDPVEGGLNIKYVTFDIPTANAMPHTAVPDGKGNVWFTEFGGGKIGTVNVKTGQMEEFAITEGIAEHPSPRPHGLTLDWAGNVWFTEPGAGRIGRFDPKTRTFKHYVVPPTKHRMNRSATNEAPSEVQSANQEVSTHTLIADPQGDIWFTSLRGDPVRKLNVRTGDFTEYVIRDGGADLYGIARDPKTGRIWYAGLGISEVGYIDPVTGTITRFPTPTPNSGPRRLHIDSNGVAWFNLYNVSKIARADPATGRVTEWDLPGPRTAQPYPLGLDNQGRVWTQTYKDDLLHMFDPKTERITTYVMPNKGLGLRDFYVDESGWMWASVFGRNQVIGFKLEEMSSRSNAIR